MNDIIVKGETKGSPNTATTTTSSELPKLVPTNTDNNSSTTADTPPEAIASSTETLDELAKKLSSLTTTESDGTATGTGSSTNEPVDPIPYLSLNQTINGKHSENPVSTEELSQTHDISESEIKSESGSIEGELLPFFAEFDGEDLSGTEYFATTTPSISPEPWDYRDNTHPQQEGDEKEVSDIELNSIESIEVSVSNKGSILDPNEYQHIFDDEKYLREVIKEVDTETGTELESNPSALDFIQAFNCLALEPESNGGINTTAPEFQQDQVGETSKSGTDQTTNSGNDNKTKRNPASLLPQSTDAAFLYCQPCRKDEEEIFTFDTELAETLSQIRTGTSDEEEFLEGFDFDPVVFAELLKFVEEEGLKDLEDTPRDYFGIDTGSCIEIPSATSAVPTIMEDNTNMNNTKKSGKDIGNMEEKFLKRQNQQEAIVERENEEQQEEIVEQENEQGPDQQQQNEVITSLTNAFKGRNERQGLGHESMIFALTMSECGNYCATASQDSSVIVWDVKKNAQLSKIPGSPDHESLRVAWASSKWGDTGDHEPNTFRRTPGDLVLATAGADGVSNIWQSFNGAREWKNIGSLNHLIADPDNGLATITEEKQNIDAENNDQAGGKGEGGEDKNEGTEIYSLQFIDSWLGLPTLFSDRNETDSIGILMTSSEDFIHIWQHCPDLHSESESIGPNNKTFEKIMDMKFTHLERGFGGVFVHLSSDGEHPDWTKASGSNIVTNARCFGGDRNPEKLVFVFDAAQCPANNLLGVALSDGTLRLVNGRGICVTILQLPGCQSHLTSFAWGRNGYRLASCIATGHVVLWDIDYGDGKGNVHPVCRAVLEGGHSPGRPLFGASFFSGDDENLLLSWGVDGKICLWDSYSRGQIGEPICILVSKGDYPIYTVDVFEGKKGEKSTIGVAGGTEGGFIGLPIFFYNYLYR